MSDAARRRWVVWALVAYGFGAVVLLFSPIGPSRILAALMTFIRHDLGIAFLRPGWVEFGANILLFVPIGLLVTLLFRRPWVGVVASLALSVSTELVQITMPARIASPRDILANVLGAALGAAIAWFMVIRRRSAPLPVTMRAR